MFRDACDGCARPRERTGPHALEQFDRPESWNLEDLLPLPRITHLLGGRAQVLLCESCEHRWLPTFYGAPIAHPRPEPVGVG